MSRDNDLPFERGSTYFGGDATLLTAIGTDAHPLEGKIYQTVDPITGRAQRLIVLKNRHSTTIAGGRGVRPAATFLGQRTGDYVGTTGGIGYIVDPEYARLAVTIAVNDLYFAIYDGFVSNVKLGASNAVDFGCLIFDTAGYLIPQSTNDDTFIVGLACQAVTSTGQGNEDVDVLVSAPSATSFDRT
jgi:hypothetical protein